MQKTRKSLVALVIRFFLANTCIFWLLGLGYLSSILFSDTLFKNYIADYSSWIGQFFVLFFTLVNYCSFMMLLAFLPALIPLILIWILPHKRFIGFVSIVCASLSVILLIMDRQIYSMFKFHLNKSLIPLIFSQEWRAVFDFSQYEILLAIAGVISVIFIEWWLARKIFRSEPHTHDFEKNLAVTWLGGMLFSYFVLMISLTQNNNLFIQQAPNLPLLTQFFAFVIPNKNALDNVLRSSEQHYTAALYAHDKLNYPRHPLQCKQVEKPYNIIFIMVDALRADSLSSMHNMSRLAANSWQFQQHSSGGNSTQSGLFSLFYSIPSNYWTAVIEQQKMSVFTTLLKQYHYETKVIWSSEMRNPPLNKGIYYGIDNLTLDGAPGKNPTDWDRYTTKEALQFLKTTSSEKPFFLNVFYNAPHAFCRTQNLPVVYQPIEKYCSRMILNAKTDPKPLYNNYLNAVAFIDNEIAELLSLIEKKGYLKNSIVIFTSDHGQEFNDNQQNYWGHTSNYTATQIQVPMVIHWPEEAPRKIQYPTSAYDLMPTLLTRLFNCQNNLSDYSIGQDLLTPTNRLPFLLAGSYVNMGIIESDRLNTLQASGQINITDLRATPISNAKPRKAILQQALNLMRFYYKSDVTA